MKKLLEVESLAFDDIHIVPQYLGFPSRKEIDLSTTLNNSNVKMRAPIFASPMDTIASPEMAIALWNHIGAIALMHRYCSIKEQVAMVEQVRSSGAVAGAAIGVKEDFIERAQALVDAGTTIICIDIAHGHSIMMKEALTKLRSMFPSIHIMAGNVATLDGFNDLSEWGADSIRVGIGSGSICSTRTQTGHGYPLLQSLIEISRTKHRAQIIADGGMVHIGDVNKALAVGAHFIMTGRLFAGTDETPGKVIEKEGKKFKVYRGMASKAAQKDWRGYSSSDEGVESLIPYKGPVKDVLDNLVTGMKGISYSGVRNLEEFREKAIVAKVSHASTVEAAPHILTR